MDKAKSIAANIIGEIKQPDAISNYGDPNTGIGKLLGIIVNFLVVGAGLYAFINIILAGYAFLSAGDDPKKAAGAWAKIWQSILGLAVVAGSFVLAAIFGQILFNNPRFLLEPKILIP